LKECFTKGSDIQFDQIVSTLSNVSENCLPSILKSLFQWYQSIKNGKSETKNAQKNNAESENLEERRDVISKKIILKHNFNNFQFD
jgi:hypothetical protein